MKVLLLSMLVLFFSISLVVANGTGMQKAVANESHRMKRAEFCENECICTRARVVRSASMPEGLLRVRRVDHSHCQAYCHCDD